MDFIINIMLRICDLSDKSFLHLFFFYMVILVIYHIFAVNIESYINIEKKVYLHDLIFMLFIFSLFAYNAYWLSNIKSLEAGSKYILKEKKVKD